MTQKRLFIVTLISWLTLSFQALKAQQYQHSYGNSKDDISEIDAHQSTTTSHGKNTSQSNNELEHLINFARYIRWPQNAFPTPSSPVIIALATSFSLSTEIENIKVGKTKDNREIMLHHYSTIPNLDNIHILYIEDPSSKFASLNLSQINTPLLTVGTSANFLQTGGIIQLNKTPQNIEFTINHNKASALGLSIHYKIQQIAQQYSAQSASNSIQESK